MTPGPGDAAALTADRGSAPAAVLAWCAGAVALATGLGLLGIGHVAGAHASLAADLAALAGADAHATGGAACPVADRVAAANGAYLAACTIEGADVRVTVEVPATPLPAMTRTARAGPP